MRSIILCGEDICFPFHAPLLVTSCRTKGGYWSSTPADPRVGKKCKILGQFHLDMIRNISLLWWFHQSTVQAFSCCALFPLLRLKNIFMNLCACALVLMFVYWFLWCFRLFVCFEFVSLFGGCLSAYDIRSDLLIV